MVWLFLNILLTNWSLTMSDSSNYIADMLLGDYASNESLEKAVEQGARGVIKSIVRSFIADHFPWLTGFVDIVVDMVCDYFGW